MIILKIDYNQRIYLISEDHKLIEYAAHMQRKETGTNIYKRSLGSQ